MPDYSGLLDNNNYGLLTGLSEGLREGLRSYRQGRSDIRDEQQQALENQMKKKMYSYDLAKSGLQESSTDASGNSTYTTSPQELEKEKRLAQEKRDMLKFQSDLTAAGDRRKLRNDLTKAGAAAGYQYDIGPDGRISGATPIPGMPPGLLGKGPMGLLSKINEKQAEDEIKQNRFYRTMYDKILNAADVLGDPKADPTMKQERFIQMVNLLKDTGGASGEGGLRGPAYTDARALMDYLPLHRADKTSFGPQFALAEKMLRDKAGEMRTQHDQQEKEVAGLIPGYQVHQLSRTQGPPPPPEGIDFAAIEKEISRRGLRGSK